MPLKCALALGDRLVYIGNTTSNGYELWSYRTAVAVTGNERPIFDSDATPSVLDHTDFGSIAEAGGERRRTFTIQNHGTTDLHFDTTSSVSVSGLNAAEFTVTRQPDASVAPAESTSFEVLFDPSAIGLRTATVRVSDSQDGGQPFEFAIQGTSVPLDFGDAPTSAESGLPSSYPTLLADDGARHGVGGPRLGSSVTAESDGQATINADGDATGNATSDDGIRFTSSLFVSPTLKTLAGVSVDLQNANPDGNRLDAWIDFNRDGDWLDPGEHVLVSADLGTTSGIKTLGIEVPAGTTAGSTFARFRLSSEGGLSPSGLPMMLRSKTTP